MGVVPGQSAVMGQIDGVHEAVLLGHVPAAAEREPAPRADDPVRVRRQVEPGVTSLVTVVQVLLGVPGASRTVYA